MPLFLPVTEKERKSWAPLMDEKLVEISKGDSQVRFTSNVDGSTPNTKSLPNKAACYAVLRPNYGNYNITCFPLETRKERLPLNEAFEFFQILTEHGIVPEDIELWDQEGSVLALFKKGDTNPHLVYTGLVAYRWLDGHPALVKEFLQIYKAGEDRHPFQILPYLSYKYLSNTGHNFLSASSYSLNPGKISLILGVAAKIYFDPEDKRGKEAFEIPERAVNSAIDCISAALHKIPKKLGETKWGGRISVPTPKYQVKRIEDLLSPKFSPLFQEKKITSERIEQILSEICTEEQESK